jgi:hypothetical protein
VEVRRPVVRPALPRLALLRPAFDELGVRDEEEGVRFAVDGVFDRVVFDGLVFDLFVDPERAGLERFVFPLDLPALDLPPLDLPPRCWASATTGWIVMSATAASMTYVTGLCLVRLIRIPLPRALIRQSPERPPPSPRRAAE